MVREEHRLKASPGPTRTALFSPTRISRAEERGEGGGGGERRQKTVGVFERDQKRMNKGVYVSDNTSIEYLVRRFDAPLSRL